MEKTAITYHTFTKTACPLLWAGLCIGGGLGRSGSVLVSDHLFECRRHPVWVNISRYDKVLFLRFVLRFHFYRYGLQANTNDQQEDVRRVAGEGCGVCSLVVWWELMLRIAGLNTHDALSGHVLFL